VRANDVYVVIAIASWRQFISIC